MSIDFVNVDKTLRQKTTKTKILEKTNVEFSGDRITGVLAPPRSGKTTVVSLTTGKLRPDKGRVKRSSLVSFPVAAGGVFNGALTGRENLAFLCRVFGFDPVPIIRFVLDFTEIGKSMDKPFKNLNRDERTRLIFTACYAIPFDTYLVDESIVGGRGAFKAQCEELVRERMQTSGFIIFTSSPVLVRRYCQDIFIMDHHAIEKVETVDVAESRIGSHRLRNGDGTLELVADGGYEMMINPR